MKEIKIYFVKSFEEELIKKISNLGIKNFMLLSNMSGFKPEGDYPLFAPTNEMEYNVSLLLFYGDDDILKKIKESFSELEAKCKFPPCLKVMVSDVEEVI